MLGKLLKYEIQATGRVFLPLYLGLLAVAAVASFTLQSNIDILKGIIAFLLVILYGALVVVTVVLLIQRFYRSLLKDEGYLMFTLPVHQATLVASKLVTACLWSLLSTIVGAVAGMIAGRSFIDLSEVSDAIGRVVDFFAAN
ncbi:MAG: ABC transporter permease, partial [Clostridiales bacterium]|nr:ABC transporter permease [Clostridiales bacterium]